MIEIISTIAFVAFLAYLFFTRKSKRPYDMNRGEARRHNKTIKRLKKK